MKITKNRSAGWRKGYILFIILIGLIASCSKDGKQINDYYTVIDSIKLEYPAFGLPGGPQLTRVGNLFLWKNSYEKRLELCSSSGELLSFVGKYGKGPGEFLRIDDFDCYGDIVYVADEGNSKIVIVELDEKNKELNYIDEFRVDQPPISLCAVSRDKILVSVMGDVNNIKLYDNKGKIIKEYSIPKKEGFDNYEDMLQSLCVIEKCGDKHILVASILGLQLYFFEFRDEDNSLIKITEREIKSFKSGLEFTERRGNKEIDIEGLGEIRSANGKYYIWIPTKHPFLEIYDKSGNFLGNAYLNKYYDFLWSFEFSSNADTLWFTDLKNDTTVYVAIKEEIK